MTHLRLYIVVLLLIFFASFDCEGDEWQKRDYVNIDQTNSRITTSCGINTIGQEVCTRHIPNTHQNGY